MVDTPAKKAVGEAAESIKHALHRISEDVVHLSDKARRVMDSTGQKASALVEDIADEATTRGRQAARVAVREVREHPVRTIAIGAAIGVLVAAYLTRRRD
jgi:ElaB/YqjD/DUF883 family membrane-anchored ribosome-binding protein